MIKELTDRFGIEIFQFEHSDPAAPAPCNELEQQLQCVTIGAHRVHAGAALVLQVLGEERFDESE